ncbi:hypothetical protein GCM10010412_066000 [Nonomuraea recticatena]|uniref:Uncharacterized protein n=1 Tax=Nonomuraea recticatena TaxID=46178 RepID=A0ABN3SNG5_9ACTN
MVELPADRCQGHVAVVAVQQGGADAAFLLLDRLADAGLGDVQPLGCPAEVQFLCQCQEDLDVAKLHLQRAPQVISGRLWRVTGLAIVLPAPERQA